MLPRSGHGAAQIIGQRIADRGFGLFFFVALPPATKQTGGAGCGLIFGPHKPLASVDTSFPVNINHDTRNRPLFG